jgi:hypothetical protein
MAFRTAMSRHPPIVHKDDHTIRGPMFCSVLAPVLRKEREDRLAAAGYILEWADIVHDLERLIETEAKQDSSPGATPPRRCRTVLHTLALPCRHWSDARNRPPATTPKTPPL